MIFEATQFIPCSNAILRWLRTVIKTFKCFNITIWHCARGSTFWSCGPRSLLYSIFSTTSIAFTIRRPKTFTWNFTFRLNKRNHYCSFHSWWNVQNVPANQKKLRKQFRDYLCWITQVLWVKLFLYFDLQSIIFHSKNEIAASTPSRLPPPPRKGSPGDSFLRITVLV